MVLAHRQHAAALPRAILVDGGGNDVTPMPMPNVQTPLERIVLQCPATPPAPGQVADTMNEAELQAFLQGVARHLTTVLRELADAADGHIPIIVHAYDYPRPTNVGGFRYMPGDLWACFEARGYTIDQGAWVMKALIDRLNNAVAEVVSRFAAQRVQYLDLRGTLTTDQGNTADTYQASWANEMHPNVPGFRQLAAVIDRVIEQAQGQAAVRPSSAS